MSITDEEFYRILRELEMAYNENSIEKLEPLWNRSLKIGWEGDVVRCAIRDAVFSLAHRYGIGDGKVTYERLHSAREKYLASVAPPPTAPPSAEPPERLKAARKANGTAVRLTIVPKAAPPPPKAKPPAKVVLPPAKPVAKGESIADRAVLDAIAKRNARTQKQEVKRNDVPPLKEVCTFKTVKLKAEMSDAIRHMVRAIEENNIEDIRWLTKGLFKSPDACYVIQAIETERLVIAKHLLQLFSPKTQDEREAVVIASIKAGWYIGCITMDSDQNFDRSRMIKVCAENGQMACLRYFIRKKAVPPPEALAIAVERGRAEMAKYLASLKN